MELKVKVSSLVPEVKVTNELVETFLNYMRTQYMFSGETEFDFSFESMVCPSANLDRIKTMLKERLDEDEATKCLTFTFSDIATIFDSQNTQLVRHILNDVEMNRLEISTASQQLKAMVDMILKTSSNCILDCSATLSNINQATPGKVTISRSEFAITKPTTALLLAEIKSMYGDRVEFSGLAYKCIPWLTYAFNYFSRPYAKTIDELKQFMQTEYQHGDVVFVSSLEQDIKPKQGEEYKPTELTTAFPKESVFQKTGVDFAYIRIGIVQGFTDDGIQILRLTLRNATTKQELQRGRFIYFLGDEPELVSYDSLFKYKESMHGAEMEASCDFIYNLISDLKPNAPRERQLYYSLENAKVYMDYIQTFVKTVKPKKEGVPDYEELRRRLLPREEDLWADPSTIVE